MPHGALPTGSPGLAGTLAPRKGMSLFCVRMEGFNVCKEKLYKSLGRMAKGFFQDRDECSGFALGFGRAEALRGRGRPELEPRPGHGPREEILDNSSFGCRLAAHSVGSEMIWVSGSRDIGIPNPCPIVQLPRGGEWLRNHVSIPKVSAVW
jgi:hypothetical protein